MRQMASNKITSAWRRALAATLLLGAALPVLAQEPPPPERLPEQLRALGVGTESEESKRRREGAERDAQRALGLMPGAVTKIVAPPAGAANAGAASAVTAVENAPAVGGFQLQNASLTDVVDQLARLAKINYVIDPRVAGRSVTLNTYGETRDVKPRDMLETILRINGAALVQTGDLYRIVPLAELARMPLRPESQERDIPEDERPMLNLIFLKFADVDELSKLVGEFLGPDAKAWGYAPANLLLVLDSRRSMHRLMELIAMFDSDTMAKQRVRVFEVRNGRPTDLAKELEKVLKSISMGKESSGVRFVPIDRINSLVAVASNPGAFVSVEEWLKKLDVKVKGASGKADTYVYRVKYGQADRIAGSIMSLYYSMYSPLGAMGMRGMGGYGMGGFGMGGYGMGGYGMGGYGMGGYGMGGYGMGMGGYGAGAGDLSGAAGAAVSGGGGGSSTVGAGATSVGTGAMPAAVAAATGASGTTDLTGGYLGTGGYGTMTMPGSTAFGPRVMPNTGDNSLLILATPEQYESVQKLLEQIDVPPRQVLIEAQILEVSLTGAFSSGVTAALEARGAHNLRTAASLLTPTGTSALTGNLSVGMVVGQSRQLFMTLTAQSSSGRTKVLSTPRVLATDSIPASITVGQQVPTLSSTAATSATSGGTTVFANNVSNVSTGTTLSITARVNPSGIVTLQIDQQVSAPLPIDKNASIQSPSFSNRQVKTQVTVQDGDMIAIGGIISENKIESSSGLPLLHRIPLLGAAFGSKSVSKDRTELVIFLTPHVVYDTNAMTEASDDLINGMKRVQKLIRQ